MSTQVYTETRPLGDYLVTTEVRQHDDVRPASAAATSQAVAASRTNFGRAELLQVDEASSHLWYRADARRMGRLLCAGETDPAFTSVVRQWLREAPGQLGALLNEVVCDPVGLAELVAVVQTAVPTVAGPDEVTLTATFRREPDGSLVAVPRPSATHTNGSVLVR